MEWISVEERLPEENGYVLVYDTTEGICTGYRCYESWQHYPIGSYAGDGCLFGVTYWMPLPKPPENNNNTEQ